MNAYLLTPELAATPIRHAEGVMERARRVCTELSARAAAADAEAELPEATFDLLRRSGLTRAGLIPEHGGDGVLLPQRVRELTALLKLVGATDLSVARIFEGHLNAVDLVYRLGTHRQIDDFARKVREGALSGVWGADDVKPLRASPISGGWRLEGRKIFASGAGRLMAPVVSAMTDTGQVLFLLDLDPGERSDISGWTAQGMRASATGTVDLTGMDLCDDQLLGQAGDFTRQPHFSGGAWRFCAVHLGAVERLVDLFREHLTVRKRDGDPYQLQRIAQCVAAATTARFWVERAACGLADGADDAEAIVALANMTRMVTERSALDVLEAIHRGVGLTSFLRPNPMERIARDLATYLRQPVPDVAMANSAKWVLSHDRPAGDLWSDDAG
jgi:alkylation response protein AidB-like acyl-CoA dehydrogenase